MIYILKDHAIWREIIRGNNNIKILETYSTILIVQKRNSDDFTCSNRKKNNNKKWKLVTQLCLTLHDPMDCSLPSSSVHGILQAWVLEWVAIPFSRGSFRSRGQIQVSCIAGRLFTSWAIRKREREMGNCFSMCIKFLLCKMSKF